jgi:hypothetical protein
MEQSPRPTVEIDTTGPRISGKGHVVHMLGICGADERGGEAVTVKTILRTSETVKSDAGALDRRGRVGQNGLFWPN